MIKEEIREVLSGETLSREATVTTETREDGSSAPVVDTEARTVQIALSSEEPVERAWGVEILTHEERAVDRTRINRGIPILMDHDSKDQVGRLLPESVEVGADKVLRGLAKFGNSQRAQEIFQDILDGIRNTVSVGYQILKMEKDPEQESREGLDTYRASAWMPLEASFVAIPADITVGVGRSQAKPADPPTNQINTQEKEREKMTEKQESKVTAEPAIRVEDVRKAELDRINDIETLADSHGELELGRHYIKTGAPVDSFREALLEKLQTRTPAERPDQLGMDKKQANDYSFMKVVNALANPANARAQEDAAFEFECSRAIADVAGKAPRGIYVPEDALATRATLTAGNAANGGNTVATDLLADSFISRLEMASYAVQLGTVMRGLSSDVAIPKCDGSNTAGWISAEGGDSAESQTTFAQVTLSPNTVGGYTDISRRLLVQSSVDVESFIRNDLAQRIGTALDVAALNGSGSSGEPWGIINTSGVLTSTIASAGAPSWAELLEFESDLGGSNALMGRLAWMTTPAVIATMKATDKASGFGQFVMDGNSCNGYPVYASSNVPSNGILFGNWADLLVGFFGGLDINVDTATGSKAGTIRIVALQDCDIAVRHAESFCVNA